jgi:hypothetical protein
MTYSSADLSVQLRVMTEPLGSLGYPFNLTHDARSYTSELRQTRNLWAHNETFNDADAFRALDTAGRLAKHLGLDGATQALSALLDEYKLRDGSERGSETSKTGVGSAAEDKLEAPQPFEHAIKQHSVSVEITAAESFSYAMVHNGFKLCDGSRSRTRARRSVVLWSACFCQHGQDFREDSCSTWTSRLGGQSSWTMWTCTSPRHDV